MGVYLALLGGYLVDVEEHKVVQLAAYPFEKRTDEGNGYARDVEIDANLVVGQVGLVKVFVEFGREAFAADVDEALAVAGKVALLCEDGSADLLHDIFDVDFGICGMVLLFCHWRLFNVILNGSHAAWGVCGAKNL